MRLLSAVCLFDGARLRNGRGARPVLILGFAGDRFWGDIGTALGVLLAVGEDVHATDAGPVQLRTFANATTNSPAVSAPPYETTRRQDPQ